MKVYDISKYMRYHNALLGWYHSIIDKQTVYRNNCYDDNCVKTNDKVYFTKLILVQISTFIHFNDVSQAMMRNATDVKIHIYRFEFISRKYIYSCLYPTTYLSHSYGNSSGYGGWDSSSGVGEPGSLGQRHHCLYFGRTCKHVHYIHVYPL